MWTLRHSTCQQNTTNEHVLHDGSNCTAVDKLECAATKPPPPVIFVQAAVNHIYATQPSVIYESVSVIFSMTGSG